MALWLTRGMALLAGMMLVRLALQDLRYRRLPNKWVIAFAALFLLPIIVGISQPRILLEHMVVATVALLISVVLVIVGAWGGGDAKLATAVMLWAGPQATSTTLLLITQLGLLLALAGLVARHMLARLSSSNWLYRPLSWLDPTPGVPYGVALSVGGCYAVWMFLFTHA